MSRRKPIVALAAVATALAVALPASASAATTTVPTIPPITFGIGAGYLQSVVCPILVSQLQLAEATGNTLGANLIGNVLLYSGCGGAAI
jgi:ABC-type sugar transport system substrate-binding protein